MLCKCGHFSIDHDETVDIATRQIGACKFCLCQRFEPDDANRSGPARPDGLHHD